MLEQEKKIINENYIASSVCCLNIFHVRVSKKQE